MAEIAFTVTKGYRNQGLTRHMLLKLVDIAQEKGISGFSGDVLAENGAMLHVLRTLPYEIHFNNFGDSLEFSFKFSSLKSPKEKKEEPTTP